MDREEVSYAMVYAAVVVALAGLVAALIAWSVGHDRRVKVAWMAQCIEAKWREDQCEVLWSIKSSSDAAAGLAAASLGASSVAAGVAASKR